MNDRIYSDFQSAKEQNDLDKMKKLCNSNPKEAIIKFEYAKLLVLNGDFKRARKAFRELLNTSSRNYSLFELGKLEVELNNIDSAKKYLNQLLSTSSRNYALLELGKLEVKFGNFNDAREYFFQLLGTSSMNYAFLELGKMELELGNIDIAKKYFNQLINTDSQDYALLELGKIEKELGNLENSRNYFTKLLDTSNKEYALLELADLDYKIGNVDGAREKFENLLDSKVRSYALFNLAMLEMKENNDVLMFKYLNKLWQDKSFNINYDLLLYLSKKLNIFFDFDYSEIKYTYTLKQFLDYDEYCAVEHIVERHAEEFSADVDIYKLFSDIGEELVEENKLKKLSFNDCYIIKKDNIGSGGEKNLFVVTLPNTKDIITMFPLYNKRCCLSDMSFAQTKQFVKK